MTIDDLHLEWLAAQNAETAWFESNRLKLNLYRRYLHDIDQRMVEAHPQLYPILLSGKAGERECTFIPQFTVPIEASDLCAAHIADLRLAESWIKKRLSQLTEESRARVEGYSKWLGTE
jgi:hypothetical protein